MSVGPKGQLYVSPGRKPWESGKYPRSTPTGWTYDNTSRGHPEIQKLEPSRWDSVCDFHPDPGRHFVMPWADIGSALWACLCHCNVWLHGDLLIEADFSAAEETLLRQ